MCYPQWPNVAAPSVLLDLRMVHGPLHGIARYALELARRLPAVEPSWQWSALVPPGGLPTELGELTPRLTQRRAGADFLSLTEQPSLVASLLKWRPDLFHATSFSVPALWPGNLVVTLHDANHLALSDDYSAAHAVYYRAIVEPRVRRASALITVSEFSRAELARHLHLSPERFQVIYNGVDGAFCPRTNEDQRAVRRRLSLPEKFFLAVGNKKRFKNLQLAAKVAHALPVPMAVLGGQGAIADFHFPATSIELHAVPDSDMPALYSAATAVLVPSEYEGFGLPALEALACGTPVICSDRGALPEIVGASAVVLPPDDPEAWVEASMRLVRQERARSELIEKGRARADRFSWDACARTTLEVYRRALRLR